MIRFNTISYTNKNRPAFGAYMGNTHLYRQGYNDLELNNKTAFMRDFETLEFVRDYLVKTFPNGAKIDEFGCSTGQKPYSLLVMLDDYNKDKKYKITGYDFKEVFAKMEAPLYLVEDNVICEAMLFPHFEGDSTVSAQKAKKIRETFFKYLPECDYNKLKTFEERHRHNMISQPWGVVVKPDEKYTKDVIDFKYGDINDINKYLLPEKSNAVIFQNALYHLTGGSRAFGKLSAETMENLLLLFRKINIVLSKDGIFVLGNLPIDHIYNDMLLKDCHYHYQKNKRIKVYDSSVIHKLLYKSGFEPVYYDKIPEGLIYTKESTDVYLPAVWKKVRSI